MSVGYGRGYYGNAQLAPCPQGRSGRGWFTTIAVVAGLGAVVWFMWPRSPKPEHGTGTGREGDEPKIPSPPSPPVNEALDQLARSRGFSSTKTFEDSVVSTARELEASGAKVSLGPYLAHLEPRLGS